MPNSYRIDKYRLLSIGGPAGSAKAQFRMEMDRKIRAYQLDNPLIYHVTNLPRSAPTRISNQIRPHTQVIGYER